MPTYVEYVATIKQKATTCVAAFLLFRIITVQQLFRCDV